MRQLLIVALTAVFQRVADRAAVVSERLCDAIVQRYAPLRQRVHENVVAVAVEHRVSLGIEDEPRIPLGQI